MARIAGVDLPRDKRVEAALPYIYGIGWSLGRRILKETGVNPDTRVRDLSEDEVSRLRDVIEKQYRVEGELQREASVVNVVAREVRALPDVARDAGGPGAPDGVRTQGYSGLRRG